LYCFRSNFGSVPLFGSAVAVAPAAARLPAPRQRRAARAAVLERVRGRVGMQSRLQQERNVYQERCACTQRVMSRARLLHERLDRVIVFDIRFRWWGLGNNLSRWLALLRFGLASGRATYLWMSDQAWSTQSKVDVANASSRRRRQKVEQPAPYFDMGAFFESEACEWDWSPAAESKVRARMASFNVSSPVTITHRCLKHGINCVRHELRWSPEGHLIGTEEEERNGSLLKLITQQDAPWLLVRPIHPGQMTAFQPSGKPAAAVLSGQAGITWGGGWAYGANMGGGCWSERAERRIRDPTSRQSALHLPYTAAVAMGSVEPSQGRALRSRINLKCEAFALLRPRPSLQALITPIVLALDALSFVSALHVRTGYPDWVALAAQRNGSASRSWARAALQPPLSFVGECLRGPLRASEGL